MKNKCCSREEKNIVGLNIFKITCGGLECKHRIIYGLIDENCKQVIALSGFRDINETSTVW